MQPADLRPVLHVQHLMIVHGWVNIRPEAEGQSSGGTDTIKQGWMGTASEVTLNTTGLVGPNSRYIVALLTSATADTPWPSAIEAINAGVTALGP